MAKKIRLIAWCLICLSGHVILTAQVNPKLRDLDLKDASNLSEIMEVVEKVWERLRETHKLRIVK